MTTAPVRRGRRIRLLVALLVVVGACGGGAPRSLVRSGDVHDHDPAVVAWIGPVTGLSPHDVPGHLAAAVHAPLVVTDPRTHLPAWGDDAPAAAVADLRSDDLRRWTLRLKPDRRWHDGTPLTAADLERGWRAAIAEGSPPAQGIGDVRATDDLTLAFALTAPFAQLPHLLVDQAFLPHHPDASSPQLGTGAYRLASADLTRPADGLVLHAVPGHPAGDPRSPAVVRIDLAPVPGPEVDVAVGADGDLVPPGGEGAAGRTRVHRTPGRQLAYLGFPLTDPRFRDQAVREAVALAIDRAALADLLGPGVQPADRLVGPGFARAPGVTCATCTADPDRAAELWPSALADLSLWFAADAGHEPVIRAIAGDLRRTLGVDVTLASAPAATLLDRIAATDVDGPFRLTWAADVSSPARVLEPLFGPRGGANDMRFRSGSVGELLTAAAGDPDVTAALATYALAEQEVLDRVPVVPLWTSTIPVAARPDISGVALDGEGRLDWAALRVSP